MLGNDEPITTPEGYFLAARIHATLQVALELCIHEPSDTDVKEVATVRHIAALVALCRDSSYRLACYLAEEMDKEDAAAMVAPTT